MEERDNYCVSFLSESTGFPDDIIKEFGVPSNLISIISSSVKGVQEKNNNLPYLEIGIKEFSKLLEEHCMKRFGFSFNIERWPNAKEYAAVLTHDTDNIERPLAYILSIKERFSKKDLFLHILGLRSLYNNFKAISRFERQLLSKSTFFLMVSNYDLKRLLKDVTSLRESGWEFSLHASEEAHDSFEKMNDEIIKFYSVLGFKPAGVREHYLRFNFEKTWQILEKNFLLYDSSVGNRDKLGFKIGLCNPFHPPNEQWKEMNILELPISLMDTTLWGYLKRDEESGFQDFLRQKELVKSVNGCFTLLWHTESLKMKGGRTYPRIIKEFVHDDCYVNNALTIARWWNSKIRARAKIKDDLITVEPTLPGLTVRVVEHRKRVKSVVGGTVNEKGNSKFIISASSSLSFKVS